MALILQIETATKTCSVALSLNGKTVALKETTDEEYTHSEKLFLYIEEVFEIAGKKKTDIAAVCVSGGPGSYTGLRIGAATAKGICLGLSIPLISLDTTYLLAKMCKQQHPNADYYVPMIDARRMEVYTSTYTASLEMVSPIQSLILTENAYTELGLESKIAFCGDGSRKYSSLCRHPRTLFDTESFASANQMSEPAFQKFSANQHEDLISFEPNYLKEFVTQSKFQK